MKKTTIEKYDNEGNVIERSVVEDEGFKFVNPFGKKEKKTDDASNPDSEKQDEKKGIGKKVAAGVGIAAAVLGAVFVGTSISKKKDEKDTEENYSMYSIPDQTAGNPYYNTTPVTPTENVTEVETETSSDSVETTEF